MNKVELISTSTITPQETNFYKRILPELDTVLDVGAYLTFFKGENVHYFEPMPHRVEELRTQVNNIGHFNTFGLGKVEEDKEIYNYIGSTYFRAVLGRGKEQGTTPIKLRCLDKYVEEHNLENISLLKIDVEGAELDVLIGGINSLKKCKYIVFEYSHDTAVAAGMIYGDIEKLLNDKGFDIFDLDQNGNFIDVEREKLKSLVELFNLVAVNKNIK